MTPDRREVEYGVRYGDGEVTSHGMGSQGRNRADTEIRYTRHQIKTGAWASDDYEPMRLVTRVIVTTTTDWERAR